MEKKDNCTHQVWTRELSFTLLGYAAESNLAHIWCDKCEQTFWIQYEERI